MSIYKISEVIGEKYCQIAASSTNFMLISYILRREEPLSPEMLYSRIDPNESDELDFSNQMTIAEATYNPNFDYGYDESELDPDAEQNLDGDTNLENTDNLENTHLETDNTDPSETIASEVTTEQK